MLTYLGFRLPEMVAHSGMEAATVPLLSTGLLPLFAFSVALTFAGSAVWRTMAIIVATAASAVWLGVYGFTGDILHPSQLLQAGGEQFEIANVIFSREVWFLLPTAGLAILGGVVVWFAQNRLLPRHAFRLGIVGNLFVLIVGGFVWLRPIVHSDIAVVYPSPEMSSFTGAAS
ncbi:hypothetical protein N9H93_05850, partial [Rhizobiaceae bacterium]|nr:hypothetical protein [Rhizobiaceae bacterium]